MVPLAEWDARTLEETLNALARGVMMVRSDVLQFPITYYFRHANPNRELSDQLPYLLHLARSLRSNSNEQLSPVDIRAALLERAVLDFMGTVGELFLPDERDDPEALMRAYLRDHAH